MSRVIYAVTAIASLLLAAAQPEAAAIDARTVAAAADELIVAVATQIEN